MIKAIDVAVNAFLPPFAARFSKFGYWRFLGAEWEKKARQGWAVESLLESMNRANIEMAGLVAFYASSEANGEDCFISAEELAPILAAHSKRLFGLVGLNPLLTSAHRYFAPRYLERAVAEHKFKAAHLALHWFDISPGDKRLYPIYEKCLELDVPVVIPLGMAPPRSGARTVVEPVLLDPVIGDFPELRIVGQRGGFPWEREAVYLSRNNLNFSVIGDWPVPQHWSSDFVGFIKQGRFPKFDAGSDQAMWGSDFPMQEPADSRRQLEQLGFSEKILAQLLRDNAIRIFKLPVR